MELVREKGLVLGGGLREGREGCRVGDTEARIGLGVKREPRLRNRDVFMCCTLGI